jgi:hypothetical protein
MIEWIDSAVVLFAVAAALTLMGLVLRRIALARRGYSPSVLAMMLRWISDVPP